MCAAPELLGCAVNCIWCWYSIGSLLTARGVDGAQFVEIHVDADAPENADVRPELEVRSTLCPVQPVLHSVSPAAAHEQAAGAVPWHVLTAVLDWVPTLSAVSLR